MGTKASGHAERIVDADGHVLEHPTAMLEYIPTEYREECFHIVTKPDGSEWLHFNGRVSNANYLALAGTGGLSLEERMRAQRGQLKYSEVKPRSSGGYPGADSGDERGGFVFITHTVGIERPGRSLPIQSFPRRRESI